MFTLPNLPYGYDALENVIDTKTMEIHHTKHHQAYVDNLNKALEKYPELATKSLEDLIGDLNNIPEDVRTAVRNNGGGHFNHSLFWTLMCAGGKALSGDLGKKIETQFESFDKFKEQFVTAALGRFGSGWTWLVMDNGQHASPAGGLRIESTANQDNPLMENKNVKILLGLDVWEHAYYLKYQNRRKDYAEGWFGLIDWEEVEKRIG